jgi:plastocyanin
MNGLRTFSMLVLFAAGAQAQDITGTIQINKKLTRRSVTATIPVYERGASVKLGKDAEEDPLAYERSRVVVYLEGPGATGAEARHATKFVIHQQNRQFSPDILAVPAGATVSFPNMDPIFHNIFSLSKPKMFDLGSYDQGESRNVIFPKPGVVSVYCHLHPNMAATIVVTPSRWYAQADRAGHFRIPNVPPGEYIIVAWHKAAGFFRRPIVIEAGRDSVADFVLPIAADERREGVEKEAQPEVGDK